MGWAILFLTLLSISRLFTHHLIIIWAILEVSLILLIPIILRYNSTTISERALKYFIIQIIRGLFILLFILLQQPILYCLITTIIIINLAGIPPVLGFYLKLLGITHIIVVTPYLAVIVFIRMAARVYFYFRLFLSSWLSLILTNNKTASSYRVIILLIITGISPILF